MRKMILATIVCGVSACLLMYIIEQFIGCSYLVKTVIKIILFTGIPLLSVKYFSTATIMKTMGIQHIRIKDLKSGFIIGSFVFIIILSAYIFLGKMIDFNSIKNDLETKLKITASSFIFVGLYITFINSFIEELFFRGFIFMNLYNNKLKKTGYILSSVLFGLYHMAIFQTWFPLPLIILSVLCLILTGMFFNFLNTKNRNFLNSWIVHIIADSAIIIIGLKMFYF